MLMKTLCKLTSLILFLTVNLAYAIAADSTTETSQNLISSGDNKQQQTFTLQQIIGTPGFILRGASNDKIFYLPVMQQWQLNNIHLHLMIYHVALTTGNIGLTLSVNDYPINSINLNGVANVATPWDIDLPISLLKGTTFNLKISSNMSSFGYSCYNLFNPNYWIYVAGDSTVTYRYVMQNYLPDLTKFPYPFINDPSIQKDTVIVVLPEKPSLEDLTALFYLTNALADRQTWRGINLITTTVSKLTDEQKNSNNIIFIGAADEIKLNTLPIKWPLATDTNGQIRDKSNVNVNDQTGIIMLSTSIWNPKFAVMAVSGNSGQAAVKAALMMRNNNFVNTVLFNEYAFVENIPQLKTTELVWNDTTFEGLGFQNQMIYGNGESSIIYLIDLPMTKTTKNLSVDLNYSVSPFLSTTQSSFLTLKVNDFPVGGTTIKETQGNQKWSFVINNQFLKPGKNQLAFSFYLKLRNRDCTPQDLALAWATIYSDSNIRAEFENKQPFLNFDSFISSTKDLAMIIPKDLGFVSDQAFQNQLINLGERMSNIKNFSLHTAAFHDDKKISDSNIVLIGNLADYPAIEKYKAQLPFYFENGKLRIAELLLPYLAISDETPVGLIQVTTSPLNRDRLLLIISALNETGYQLAFDLFTDPKKNQLVNGDVVLIYENGTFTSIQSQRLLVKAGNRQNINLMGHKLYIIFIILTVSVITLMLASLLMKKIKRYFGKSEK